MMRTYWYIYSIMDTDGSLFATPRVQVGSESIKVCTTQKPRAAVSTRFLDDGHGFKASNVSGRHTYYFAVAYEVSHWFILHIVLGIFPNLYWYEATRTRSLLPGINAAV